MKLTVSRFSAVLRKSQFLHYNYLTVLKLPHHPLNEVDQENITYLIHHHIHERLKLNARHTLFGTVKLNRKDQELFLVLEKYSNLLSDLYYPGVDNQGSSS